MAIKNSKENICILADDDVKYVKNYKEIIQEAYERNPKADVIIFEIESLKAWNIMKKGIKEYKNRT